MNLVFIYGPPAAGKLTVAKELGLMSGYKVYENHIIPKNIEPLFPYDDDETQAIKHHLQNKLRWEIFQTAAAANVNFITTFGQAGAEYFEFFRRTQEVVKGQGGEVYFVQLNPSTAALLDRVDDKSRRDKVNSRQFLDKLIAKNPEIFQKFPDIEHLSIDNTNLSAVDTAKQIYDHYKLP